MRIIAAISSAGAASGIDPGASVGVEDLRELEVAVPSVNAALYVEG